MPETVTRSHGINATVIGRTLDGSEITRFILFSMSQLLWPPLLLELLLTFQNDVVRRSGLVGAV